MPRKPIASSVLQPPAADLVEDLDGVLVPAEENGATNAEALQQAEDAAAAETRPLPKVAPSAPVAPPPPASPITRRAWRMEQTFHYGTIVFPEGKVIVEGAYSAKRIADLLRAGAPMRELR